MLLNLVFWYLALAVAGWLAFPLAYRLLAFLPDRGLALSRPVGLLLWSYAFWMLASLGILQNNTGGVLFALLVLAGLSLWRLAKGDRHEIAAWLRERGRLVLVTELLFLALFALFAVIRAANPDASGTEKPMELAFINSILRSPTFPPADPWLSGYAISYYYFGYIMVSVLARISGTPGGVAFNLALISWFALAGLAAYGLLYNLLAARGKQLAQSAWRGAWNLAAPLLAPLFVLIASNLEGFLEMLHAGGLFWQQNGSGEATSRFWQWLNIAELTRPPSPPFDWIPKRPGGIWWWRASRVVQDFALDGSPREIIDEIPAFSYLLGDLHPHVLSMPFVLLALGLALNVFLRLRESADGALHIEQWVRTLEFWLVALALGGLSFLNTWDFPFYVALFAAAVTLARLLQGGLRWGLIVTFLETAVALGLAGGVLYLPFYLGFASQANGLLPSLVFFTRGIYFWIMFGTLLVPIVIWLFWMVFRWRRAGRIPDLAQGLLVAIGLVAGLWLLSGLDGLRLLGRDPGLSGIWGAQAVAAPGATLLRATFALRLAEPGTWLSLIGLLALVWGLVQVYRCRVAAREDGTPAEASDEALADASAEATAEAAAETGADPETGLLANRADPFVLLMILLGIGLVLFPEFFYLRDQFGYRINTIFKFYFQTWIVWAVAAGYAAAVLLADAGRPQDARHPADAIKALRVVFPVVLVALLAMALVYPLFGVLDRTNSFHPAAWTLDGAAYLGRYNPDDLQAIQWLQTAPYGVLAEAVGGSYTEYARVSEMSGLPTVIGWPGHESQWRGGEKEKGTREPDIKQLYQARQWDQASQILDKYHIRYVYFGSLERSTYHANDSLFQKYLKPVYHNASVTIYEVPGYNAGEGEE